MVRFVFIHDKNRDRYLRIITPVGKFFARAGIHPNTISITGLILSAVAGFIYSSGAFFWAAWVVVAAGICDTLDGLIARQAKKGSIFGAFFDSALDRYGDMFLFLGLAYYFSGGENHLMSHHPQSHGGTHPWTVLILFLAVAGSFMVSYARARAEGLGIECRGGMMQRPERMVLLIIGSLLGAIPGIGEIMLKGVLLILAISTHLTAVYRIIAVRKQILKEK